jgi:hypothetical protein
LVDIIYTGNVFFLSRNAMRREEEVWRLLERAACREASEPEMSLQEGSN